MTERKDGMKVIDPKLSEMKKPVILIINGEPVGTSNYRAKIIHFLHQEPFSTEADIHRKRMEDYRSPESLTGIRRTIYRINNETLPGTTIIERGHRPKQSGHSKLGTPVYSINPNLRIVFPGEM